jgi:hypothetical protein
MSSSVDPANIVKMFEHQLDVGFAGHRRFLSRIALVYALLDLLLIVACIVVLDVTYLFMLLSSVFFFYVNLRLHSMLYIKLPRNKFLHLGVARMVWLDYKTMRADTKLPPLKQYALLSQQPVGATLKLAAIDVVAQVVLALLGAIVPLALRFDLLVVPLLFLSLHLTEAFFVYMHIYNFYFYAVARNFNTVFRNQDNIRRYASMRAGLLCGMAMSNSPDIPPPRRQPGHAAPTTVVGALCGPALSAATSPSTEKKHTN